MKDADALKDLVIIVLVVLAVLGPVLYMIKQGSDSIKRDEQACEARGGVYVTKYSGFACVVPK